MFNLASLVRPKTAPVEDQRDQLARLKEAHAAAQRAVQEAQEAFDLEGTPATQKALAKAQEAEREAADYLGRAQRNLQAAEAVRAAAERETKEQQAKELRAQLADNRVAAQLIEAESKAWLGVVRAQLARLEHHDERRDLQRQLLVLEVALHGDGAAQHFRFDDTTPSVYAVAVELQSHAEQERDQRRREILAALIRMLAPGGVR
jgi:hypothetical protein